MQETRCEPILRVSVTDILVVGEISSYHFITECRFFPKSCFSLYAGMNNIDLRGIDRL